MAERRGDSRRQAVGAAKSEVSHDSHEGKRQVKDGARTAVRHPDQAAREVGRDAEQHPRAVAGGAATGAAAGGLFGGPPGAIFGGIFGAIRGLAAADAFDVVKKRLGRKGDAESKG